jgi:phosphatidylglycerol:prolipoprotein diacylglycerol transferase
VLAAYFHTISPFLFEFSPGIGVRWYGLSYALGFIAGWALLRWLSARGVTPLTKDQVTDAMLTLCIGVVLGGRLGYVLFYDPALLLEFTSRAPFWGVFALNKGGMSSHGGMLGVLAACYLISRKSRRDALADPLLRPAPMLHIMDLTALACTPGLMFGRLANFINGELLGQIAAPPGVKGPWYSVQFPQEVFSGHAPALTPEQSDRLGALIDSYRVGAESDGSAFDRMIAYIQHNSTAPGTRAADTIEILQSLIAARYPSQLVQATAEGLILGLFLLLLWRTPRRIGTIVAAFLIGYGVMRIGTEFVRLPDSGLASPTIAGLTRGQILSFAMIVGGVAAAMWGRNMKLVFGGWARRTIP